MELYERIRRDHAEQTWSIRRLAKEHRCHRREVRQALRSAVPPAPAELRRPKPVLGPWIPTIDAMLAEDARAPRKQRHTAHRIYVRLVTEYAAKIGEPTVRAWVRERRRQLYGVAEVMVPQVHDPGQEAEVDLSEADVDFNWGRETVTFFQMRACNSGAAFHWPMRAATQQAFLEAHARAFEHFGGVFGTIRYDNLSSAVRKVLRGRTRLESERFTLLRSHYLFKAEFCQPGLRGAHEKGGVEGEVGYFRRNHLVPVPTVVDWDHLVVHCQRGMTLELGRRLDGRDQTVGEAWEAERGLLRQLPADPFDARLRLTARVDAKGRVSVLRNRYSVPVRLAGLPVEVDVSSEQVTIRQRMREVASHPRLYGTGEDSLVLDHYLEVLQNKPRALRNSVPLRQATANGTFPKPYWELLHKLDDRLGESESARQMVDILLLHRSFGAATVLAAVEQGLRTGACDFNSVAIVVRALSEPRATPAPMPTLRVLHNPDVPVPDCSEYDRLLTEVD